MNTISVSNSLNPDQARHFAGPELSPNCLQGLSADNKSPIARYLQKQRKGYNSLSVWSKLQQFLPFCGQMDSPYYHNLTNLSQMEFPTDINWTSPFPILGLLGGIFHLYLNLKRNFCMQTSECSV